MGHNVHHEDHGGQNGCPPTKNLLYQNVLQLEATHYPHRPVVRKKKKRVPPLRECSMLLSAFILWYLSLWLGRRLKTVHLKGTSMGEEHETAVTKLFVHLSSDRHAGLGSY